MSTATSRDLGAADTLPRRPRSLVARAHAALGSLLAAVLGVAPHVLHHAGPLAGAAILGGVGGSLLFGAIGLVAAVPFLLRMRARTGSWRIPAALLALFAVVFSLSAFVIGPALNGNEQTRPAPTGQPAPASPSDAHSSHHE